MKYYWIKLKKQFFENLYIKKLRKIAGGDTYTIIYLKMMIRALEADGTIAYNCSKEDFAENLALDIYEDEENIKVLLVYLTQNKMAEFMDDGCLFLPGVKECTGTETDSAARVRKHREHQKALQCNGNVTDMLQESNKNVTVEYRDKSIDNRVVDTTDDIANIFDFWNRNIHPITPYEAEELREIYKEAGYSNLVEAMKRGAGDSGKRNLSYIRATARGLADGVDFKAIKENKNIDDQQAARFKRWLDGALSDSEMTQAERKAISEVGYQDIKLRKAGESEKWLAKLCAAFQGGE